jgi:hypothetical protein
MVRGLIVLTLIAATFLPAAGATRLYTLDLYDRQRVAFELEIQVHHPGVLTVEAEWEPSRVLTLKLQGPGVPPYRVRRTGPSPQRLEVEVSPDGPHLAEVWRLSILGHPAMGAGGGRLTVTVPDPPAEPEEEILPAEPPEPEPEPWMVPVRPPARVGADRIRLFETVEGLRRVVVLPGWETSIDSCGWQSGFLQYAVRWRELSSGGPGLPTVSTRRYLQKLSDMVRQVDELRTSDDPVLTGPVPDSSAEKRVWLSLRRGRILPLEREIDLLLDNLRNGFAPELEVEDWPQRFISCLMACERFLEEKTRVGEERASNREIADTQWRATLAAADVMEALASLSAVLPEEGH